MSGSKQFIKRPLAALAAKSVALVAAVFSLAIAVLLVADHVRLVRMDPLNDPHLLQLRDELAKSTGDNAALIEQIRTYDLYARRAFFGNQAQRRMGGLLLLGGSTVCFLALRLAAQCSPKLPAVGKPEREDHAALNAQFRQMVAGSAILLVALALFVAFSTPDDLATLLASQSQASPSVAPAMPVQQPAAAGLPVAMSTNWPSFRGSGGYGVAFFTNAPVAWNIADGENVRWKTKVPLPGFNSPIVWNGRVFLSGSDGTSLAVYCFDADSGAILWNRPIESPAKFPEVSEDTGCAAPSMSTDGKHVFAIFANGELACLDMDGNPVWQQNLGVPKNSYGMSSSLATDGERLFVQYDQGDKQQALAFDNATGKPVWQAQRKYSSWSSPALITFGGVLQLVLNDERNTSAYDPASGKLLWEVKCMGDDIAPSPAYNGKDTVFVAVETAKASALKLGAGTPSILWQYGDCLPDISSPLATEKWFFLCTSAGDIVCLDAATGKPLWHREFDDGFTSSPVLVGDRVYVFDTKGVAHIFAANGEYREIASIETGEPVFATPAYMDGRIFIRGKDNLYCIGKQ